jgi:hypothetical protein
MDLRDAISKVGQILDEERMRPTVKYQMAVPMPLANAAAAALHPLSQRGRHPRAVQEQPEKFVFRSANFDLLCTILDQVPQQDRPALLAVPLSRIADRGSYRRTNLVIQGAGQWQQCSSELPLVAEFVVRRGDKQLFIGALSKAALSPGLTLLLIQLEEMIALSFTLFTDEEYTSIRSAMQTLHTAVTQRSKLRGSPSTTESIILYTVIREVAQICDAVSEACRTASFLYLKGSLLPGMNLEINQDKNTVSTFLQKLAFPDLLIQSLEEAERLYRTDATLFDLKSSLAARVRTPIFCGD